MQILSSGSFVNLDNKEKIESLIFTAKEMGRAAIETEGFVNEPENNRRLALEIWHGAEYMTRDHEEAQVKNIFVNNFLDCLREIRGSAETVSENTVSEVETSNTTSVVAPPQDEFLGLVSTEEVKEKSWEEISRSIDSKEIQTVEIAVSAQNDLAADVEIGETKFVEPAQESQATIDEATNEEIVAVEPQGEETAATAVSPVNNSSCEKPIENNRATAKVPGAIVLPEKEPYRWEKCTVTAMIQLLPADDFEESKRKAVLSVRTHDFAPQFSIVELVNGEAILSELLPALENSFEKYKAGLPLKVMDKMKKEKSVAKKQPSKAASDAKINVVDDSAANAQSKSDKTQPEKAVAESENGNYTTVMAMATVATAKPAAAKPAVVAPTGSGQQGSLFGF